MSMILLFSPSATPGMFSLRTLASRSATTEKLEGPLSCCLSFLLSPAENQEIPANAKPGEDIYGWRLAIFRKNAYKKVPGECYQHSPGRYDALASPYGVTWIDQHAFSPRPVPAGRGPLF